MKAGTPPCEPLYELRCPPVTGKFQAGRSILPALLCALKAVCLLPVSVDAQDAGLWPEETIQKDRALLPAGGQKAKSLALYLKASRILREEGPEEALPLLREAMALDPGDSTLAGRTASLAVSAGQPEEARRLLEETVKRHPDDEGPLFALTRFLIDHQGPDAQSHAAVLSFVRKATAKFPGSPGLCRLAVRMHVGDQRRDEAQAAVRQTLARDSQDPRFWLAMTPVAREAFPLDDPDTRAAHTAIVTGCMEKAIVLGAADPSVWEEAGDFYARLPAQEKAVACYQKVTSLQPGNLAVRRKLGQCLRLTGDMEGARRLFEELLRIDASDAVSHRAMVSLLEAA
ncbi:MAG TPA: tetratricopeptide repeat protein, partial [Verrucomicrobiales bacterium]|nr:tetratricopeptide repeat protein [Verrucomicrobiales bacterium]